METENAIIIALIILILGAAAVAFIITESGVSFNQRADDLNMSVKVNNTTETINFTDDITGTSSSSESGTVASSSSGNGGYSSSNSGHSNSGSQGQSGQQNTNTEPDTSDPSDGPEAGQEGDPDPSDFE